MRLSSLHSMLEVPPVKTWPPTMTGRAKSARQGVVGVRGERWILPGPRAAVTEGETGFSASTRSCDLLSASLSPFCCKPQVWHEPGLRSRLSWMGRIRG